MKNLVLLVAFTIFGHASAFADTATDQWFQDANNFLRKYVSGGKVNYKAIKSNRTASIDPLYNKIKSVKVNSLSESERKAFYVNAYNLIVIHEVTERYPLKSVINVDGFFDKQRHNVGGEMITLNQLEKEKLIKTYDDPRFHFVLVCAAIGCPQIDNRAYLPSTVNKQLEERTKYSLNNNYFIRYKSGKKKVEISKIFEWYEKDFTGKGQTVLSFINKYRTEKIPGSYPLAFYEYDWTLNKQ